MGADRPWVDGEGIPAEDETNNSDMTLPKVNLALLRDDMSRFLHCAASCEGTRVITLPFLENF